MTNKTLARLSSNAQYPIDADLCAVNGWSTSQFHSHAVEEFHRAITELHNRPLIVRHIQSPKGNYCEINGGSGSGYSVAPTKRPAETRPYAKKHDKFWTKEEDFIVGCKYPGGGASAVMRSFKDVLGRVRSRSSVYERASFLRVRHTGLKSPNLYKSRGRPKRIVDKPAEKKQI